MILQPPPGLFPRDTVVAGFSLRDENSPGFNNMSFNFGTPEETQNNRTAFLSSLEIDPSRLCLGVQEHGVGIIHIREDCVGCISGKSGNGFPSSDGLITDLPGYSVGVLVADCCCLLVADERGEAVGAFHAGWRGTLAGMAPRAVASFQEGFGISGTRLKVWMGPAICGKCFEVGREIWRRFQERWPFGDYLLEDPFRIDLVELNRIQLIKSGVPVEAIAVSGWCTLENERCFSHRRGDEPEGRMLGVIGLRQSER